MSGLVVVFAVKFMLILIMSFFADLRLAVYHKSGDVIRKSSPLRSFIDVSGC